MQWSSYQTVIFEEASRRTGDNCAVVARAGSGKTTSLLEALNHVPYRRVLLCAFNKSIQLEMERRAPSHVMTRTLHAIGLRVHQMNLAHHSGKRAEVDPEKAKRQSVQLMKEKRHYWLPPSGQDDYHLMFEMATAVRKTAAYAKNVLVDDIPGLMDIAAQFDLPSKEAAGKVAKAAVALMERAADEPYKVDFDDMVWMPWYFGYGEEVGTEMLRFDVVLVDEAQDLNAAQHWMVKRMRHNGRVIGFLDDRQTLYAFRGADRNAISHIIGDPKARQLSLPISYRCPMAVIDKARLVVPDIEPAPDAKDGTVTLVEYNELLDEAAPGDFILSRTNAPLMTTCLRLLRRNRPATIAGRDLGQSLIKLLDKSKANDIPGLTSYLYDWLAKEEKRHMPERPERLEAAKDRVACLFAVGTYCSTVDEIRTRLNDLFTDKDSTDQIVCSTVHKAKGLERDTVWLLHATFGYPEPKPWQDRWSEENIWYVAVTRARDTLRFVETPLDEIMGATGRRPVKRSRHVAWRS